MASTLATTAAMDGVPLTVPNPGCVTSMPTSIVGACMSAAMFYWLSAWFTPPIFMFTLRATFAKYCGWPFSLRIFAACTHTVGTSRYTSQRCLSPA